MILSPPIPEFEAPPNDFILKCNGYDYNINKSIFSNYSSHFSKLTNSLTTQFLQVEVQYSQSIFSSFVNACQKRPFLIHLEDLNDFISLCDEWGAPSVKTYLGSFSQQLSTVNDEKIEKHSELRYLQEQIKQLRLINEKMQIDISELRGFHDKHVEKQQISESQDQSKITPASSSHNPKIINYTDQPLNGLIFWLHQQVTSRYSTLHDSGLLTVTTSSTSHLSSSSPYMLFEDNPDCKWFTENRRNQWLKIDLIDHVIEVSGYTLKVCGAETNLWYLRNWKLEGSVDDITWKIIDEQRTNKTLDIDTSIFTWTCMPCGPFRYIKITQTGPNQNGDYVLMLSSIEFFGKIEQRPPVLF